MDSKYKFKGNIYTIIILIGIILAIVLNMQKFLRNINTLISVLSPLFLASFMAFILNLLVTKWESIYFPNSKNKIINKSRRGICILLSIFTVSLIIYFIASLIAPQVSKSISVFIEQFPELFDKAKESLASYSTSYPGLTKKLLSNNVDGQQIIQKFIKTSTIWAGGFISILGSFFGTVTTILMASILAIYIVAGKETLMRQFDKLFKKIIPETRLRKTYYILDEANSTFRSFFIGQFIEAVILGALCTIGMYLFGFPYPAMIGSVVGFTTLIPLIGAFLGGLFGFLMIFAVNPFSSMLFLVFLIVLQQFESNVIYPRVVGTSVGLPAIWVLASIIVGGGLFGFLGLLFCVPFTATVYKLIKKAVNDTLFIDEQEPTSE